MSSQLKGLVFAVCAVVGLALAPAAPAQARQHSNAAVVERWLEVELEAIAANRINPPRASRELALLSVAMDRAAIESRGSSKPAIDAAATTVLGYLFPDLALRAAPGSDRANGRGGRALGRRIGDEMVARAAVDGADIPWVGSVPSGPGMWVPTPPAFANPLEPGAASWRPWNLESGSEFRPPPPFPFGGPQWTAEVQQVYDVSRALTPEQRAIALFWADGSGTITPPGHWNRIALDLIRDGGLNTDQAARVLAALNTAQADAFIACWDAKYAYWTMRPVTAVRMLIDPAWSPLIATPPFPSYTSGHATTSAAAATVLSHFFPAEAGHLRAMAFDAALSRLYGGIHFWSDNAAGMTLGESVGQAALSDLE